MLETIARRIVARYAFRRSNPHLSPADVRYLDAQYAQAVAVLATIEREG